MGDSGKVMLLPRGEYYSATPYEELDCVYYQGRSYVCKQASTGHAPTDTTYWQPMTPDASAEIQALTNQLNGNWSEGGKNLFTATMVQGALGPSGAISESTTRISSNDFVAIEGGKTYTLSGKTSATGKTLNVYVLQFTAKGTTGTTIGNWQSLPYTFTPAASSNFIMFMFKYVGDADITPTEISEVQIEAGSTATDYQPYAMTNKELTDVVTSMNSDLTVSSDVTSELGFVTNIVNQVKDLIEDGKSISGIVTWTGHDRYAYTVARSSSTRLFFTAYNNSAIYFGKQDGDTISGKYVTGTAIS